MPWKLCRFVEKLLIFIDHFFIHISQFLFVKKLRQNEEQNEEEEKKEKNIRRKSFLQHDESKAELKKREEIQKRNSEYENHDFITIG